LEMVSGLIEIVLWGARKTRFIENKCYLKRQNYNGELVDKQFDKASQIERPEFLKDKVKTNKKVFPLVLDFNPLLLNISQIVRKHTHLLRSSSHLSVIFHQNPSFQPILELRIWKRSWNAASFYNL
jgi:hypothetical protein